MALNFLLDALSPALSTHDEYSPFGYGVGNACMVHIKCPGKRRDIYAMLSGPISLNVNSEWKGIFENLGLSQLLELGDGVISGLAGRSIRQPWFGRKMWGGTKPLEFQLPFQFLSFDDAKEDVYLPMVDLMSLLYPKVKNDREGISARNTNPNPAWELLNDLLSKH